MKKPSVAVVWRTALWPALPMALLLASCSGTDPQVAASNAAPPPGETVAPPAPPASLPAGESPFVAFCIQGGETADRCACADAALRRDADAHDYAIYLHWIGVIQARTADGDAMDVAVGAADEQTSAHFGVEAERVADALSELALPVAEKLEQCR